MKHFIFYLGLVCSSGLLLACRTTNNSETEGHFVGEVVNSLTKTDLSKLGLERKEWLDRVTYANSADAPSLPSRGNEIVRFVFEMPIRSIDTGHVGIAIGNDFYDYGTVEDLRWKEVGLGWDWSKIKVPYVAGEGAPWWCKNKFYPKWPEDVQSLADINYNVVVSNLDNLVDHDETMLVVPMEVPIAQANKIRDWWKEAYATRPTYRVPGNHCVSMVIESIETSEPTYKGGRWALSSVWLPELTSPVTFARKLLDDSPYSWNQLLHYEHKAGPNKGKPLKALVARRGIDLRTVGYEPPNLPTLDQLKIPQDRSDDSADRPSSDPSPQSTEESSDESSKDGSAASAAEHSGRR